MKDGEIMDMNKRFVYADNAATTKLSNEAFTAMLPYLTDIYSNASSLYAFGNEARAAVEKAREQVASALGAAPREIFFTSGGSESDNWAIKGVASAMAAKGKKHIISSKFEHHAVLHTLEALKKQGFEVTLLDVHSNGLVRVDELEAAIRPDTALVTIMFANNEIGTIQPVKEIGEVCKKHHVLFHTDAVQAVGHVKVDVNEIGCDMLSLSGHKFNGPKGVGALYIRNTVRMPNLIDGGAQERGKRAGTENTAALVGMGVAIENAVKNIDASSKKLCEIRDYVIDNALKITHSRVNGDRTHRLPGNVSLCFEGIEGESLLLMLDAAGVCASSGSACTSGSLDPSHVLLSIGLPHAVAHGSLRLTFSDDNTMEDAKHIIDVLSGIVDRLRTMSPLWEKILEDEKCIQKK